MVISDAKLGEADAEKERTIRGKLFLDEVMGMKAWRGTPFGEEVL